MLLLLHTVSMVSQEVDCLKIKASDGYKKKKRRGFHGVSFITRL